MINYQHPILIDGNSRLAFSVAACFIKAGLQVILMTEREEEMIHYFSGQQPMGLTVLRDCDKLPEVDLALLITAEDAAVKKEKIRQIDQLLPRKTLIAVNSESVLLKELQENLDHPERLIIANWVEPVETTLFLELVANTLIDKQRVVELETLAKDYLKKDPYIVEGELGYRGRLLASLVREAFYLVEYDYANFEDIDRACRNDSGYYLPFAGNLRYMDLMGTYAYGMVMKDLNPDLSNSQSTPDLLKSLINNGHTGMDKGKGFYNYENGEAEGWDRLIKQFSVEVKELMDKYPFNFEIESTSEMPDMAYNNEEKTDF